MKKGKKLLILVISTLILVGIDQYTKILVVKNISIYEHIDLIKKLLYLTYIQNTGAAFSMLEGAGNIFFSLITFASLGFLFYLYMTTDDKRYQLGYVLIFAGAIGNYIDRMMLNYVRDFIGVYIFGWEFPIFNFADICITCGFIFVIGLMLFDEIKEKSRWKKELSK
ncbi:MAG: signal peptidase II [Holdemanella sp.]|nr:signal peptidase II [Holdemanella sp.]